MVDKKELQRRKEQRIYQINNVKEDLNTIKWNIKNVIDCFNGRFTRLKSPRDFEKILISDLVELERVTKNLHNSAKTLLGYVEYWQKKNWYDK
ncbi:MAG: hypothetical protein ACFFAN_12435 [Promethearchaeota archaeon]